MATKAIPVLGSTIKWKNTASSTGDYVGVPEPKNVVVPQITQDYIEVTNLDSTSGFREYIAGLKDGGELGLECNYTPDGYDTANTYFTDGTVVDFLVTLPKSGTQTQGDTFEWSAVITPEMGDGPIDGEVTFTINMRVSGAVTYVKGA